MKNKSILTESVLLKSFEYSIILQIITGIISLFGFFISLKKEDFILYEILFIESFVQLVEGIWYVLFYFKFKTKNYKNLNQITPKRYYDWAITTPIMLISTVLFMEYEYNVQQNNPPMNSIEIIKKYPDNFAKILFYNWMMLYTGYQYEKNSKQSNLMIGFLFFFLSFFEIYTVFAKKTQLGTQLFWFVFLVWFFYGVAAMMNAIPKNIAYNGLDIISKNFYGILILYKIYEKRI